MLEVLSFLTSIAQWIVLATVLFIFGGLIFLIVSENPRKTEENTSDVAVKRRPYLRSVNTQSVLDTETINRATEYRNDFTG